MTSTFLTFDRTERVGDAILRFIHVPCQVLHFWMLPLPDLNLLDYSVWDILQELVY